MANGCEDKMELFEDVILYSTGCPKCRVLEAKLKNRNIIYHLVTDRDEMLKKGFTKVPVLKINGKFLDFYDANNWINNSGSKSDAYRA